jgi:hypothetical protein
MLNEMNDKIKKIDFLIDPDFGVLKLIPNSLFIHPAMSSGSKSSSSYVAIVAIALANAAGSKISSSGD